jgi:flagellar biosynthesis protein FlhA
MMSAAAAIIVTRISDSGQFEDQINKQMLASPSVLYGAAAVMIALALIPGMPGIIFMLFGATLAFAAWRMGRPANKPVKAPASIEATLLVEATPDLDWRSLPVVEPLAVAVGYKLAALVDPSRGAPLLKRVKGMRQSLSESLGLLLPAISVRDDLALKPTQYSILLNASVLAQAEVYPDHLMAIASAHVYGELDGIPGIDPAYGLPVTWIEAQHKSHALGLGYQVVDIPSTIATHLSKVIKDQLPELLRFEDVGSLQERLASLAPKLAAALEKAYNPSQLLKILRLLLAENVSLKDIVPIASTLVDNAEATKDPILLAAELRCTLRRQIVSALCGPTGAMTVFNIGNELETLLLGSLNQARQGGAKVALDNFPMDPQVLAQLQQHMPVARDAMKGRSGAPMLLVTPQIRPVLARYARLFAPGLNVLSYNEVPEQREINVVGSLG